MPGRSRRRLGFGGRALGPRQAGLMLGLESRRGGVSRRSFLFGTIPRFPRRLSFRRHARQRGGLGDLLVAKLLVRQIGGAPFRFAALAGECGKFLFFPGTDGGGRGKFGGGELPPLGLAHSALLGLDAAAQGDFGESLGVRLLRCRGHCRRLGSSTTECVFRRERLCLPASFRGGHVLGGHHLARLGGRAAALRRTGARQGVRLGESLGVGGIRGGEIAACRDLPTLPLDFLQFLQQFAQTSTPRFRINPSS